MALDDSLWSDFAATFPDQKKMLEKIVKAEPRLTCKKAIQRSKRKGPAAGGGGGKKAKNGD